MFSLLCPVTNQRPKVCIYSFALGIVRFHFFFANIMIFLQNTANVEQEFRDDVFGKGRNTPVF